MATPESVATDGVRLRASQLNARVFRNNSGACMDAETKRLVRFGLGNDGTKAAKSLKFGDYIGYTPVTITADMVGKTLAVFTNLEIKPIGAMDKTLQAACSAGSREHFQWQTCEMVKAAGGFAGFACTGEDVDKILSLEQL